MRRTRHLAPRSRLQVLGVVSYWADKSSATTGWTLPAGQTQRSISLGTGPGRITSVASDLNAAAATGASPARTATANGSTGKATMWTVVLSRTNSNPNVARLPVHHQLPAGDLHGRRNRPPTDTAPGTVASYAWDFGDGHH